MLHFFVSFPMVLTVLVSCLKNELAAVYTVGLFIKGERKWGFELQETEKSRTVWSISAKWENKDKNRAVMPKKTPQTNLILISMDITTGKILNRFTLIFNKHERQLYHCNKLKSLSCFSFRKLGVKIVSKIHISIILSPNLPSTHIRYCSFVWQL